MVLALVRPDGPRLNFMSLAAAAALLQSDVVVLHGDRAAVWYPDVPGRWPFVDGMAEEEGAPLRAVCVPCGVALHEAAFRPDALVLCCDSQAGQLWATRRVTSDCRSTAVMQSDAERQGVLVRRCQFVPPAPVPSDVTCG